MNHSLPSASAPAAAVERRWPSNTLLGVLCGAGAAFGWAVGLAGALHGIGAGLGPADLTLHRYAWLGPILLFFVFRHGLSRPGGMSWGTGLALTLFAGPPLALFSYIGFLGVPLGHGAVIQPSSASLGGLLLTALFLKEPLSRARLIGALGIVAGLVIYAGEAAATIGRSGILGDLSFMAAGLCWAVFGLLLGFWRIEPMRAAAVVTALSFLVYLPIHVVWFGFERIIAAGLADNVFQGIAQGVMASAGGIYLFTRAVAYLGPGRAAVFPVLVPLFTLAIGYFLLGEIPTLVQIAGLIIVLTGFAFVLKR